MTNWGFFFQETGRKGILVTHPGSSISDRRLSKEQLDVLFNLEKLLSKDSLILSSCVPSHPFPPLASRSRLPVRVASDVSELHAWWRHELTASDDSS